MPGFVKPTRKVVNIEDAFGELIGKKLIKDLHDNEEICPVCHGTGLRIEDNPYGLSDDPDKRAGQFPYTAKKKNGSKKQKSTSRMHSDHYLQWHKATFTLTTKDISAVGRISLIARMTYVKSSRESCCTYGEPKR